MSRVCIFDVDNTLTHGIDASQSSCCPQGNNCLLNDPQYQPNWPTTGSGTSQYVLDTIKKCKNNGYDIAIATAESGLESMNPHQKRFIKAVTGKQLQGTPMFQNSCTAQGIDNATCVQGNKDNHPCCANEHPDKTNMYNNIMNHKNIPKNKWNRSIVFDDAQSNLDTAKKLGFRTCQASPKCKGVYCNKGCGIPLSCVKKKGMSGVEIALIILAFLGVIGMIVFLAYRAHKRRKKE